MGLDSEMLEGQKRNKVGLSYLPVLYGALPLSDFVDVLQPPLPLVDEPSHVLHGIQGSLHILEIPGEGRGVRWAEWLLSLHSGGVAWHRAGDGTRSSTCRLAQLFCAAITHLLLLLGQLLRHSYGLVTNLSHLWGRGELNLATEVQIGIAGRASGFSFSFCNITQHIHNAAAPMLGLVCGAEVKQFNSNWLVSNRS